MHVFPYGPLVQAQVNPKYPFPTVGAGFEVVFEACIDLSRKRIPNDSQAFGGFCGWLILRNLEPSLNLLLSQ